MEKDYATILQSPTLFAINILGVTPFRHQAELLEDESPRILIVSGRQAGKSTMLAIKALWNAFVRPEEDILIVAPTLRQSKIVYQRITDFILSSPHIKKHVVRSNMDETRFDNGSYIRCLTASKTGETIRGFSCTILIFDEAGSIMNDDVFSAVEPSLAVRGRQLILSGTPRGTRGYYYTNYANNKITKRWNIYKFVSKVNPRITDEYLKEKRSTMTEAMFKQEYEAEFIDEIGLFYPIELVETCMESYQYTIEKKPECKYYLGADISRAGADETAIVIIEVPNDITKKIKVVWAETLNITDITVTAREIERKAMMIDADEILIDAIGVGGGVYDLVREKLKTNVSDVILEGEKREQAYTDLKVLLESHKIILNEEDEKMRYQFGSYTLKEKSGGGIRIVKSEDIHDDLVDALVLALYGVTNVTKYTVFTEGVDFAHADARQWALKEAMSSVNVNPMRYPTFTPLDIYGESETNGRN
jgi:hypothetical protein